MHQMQQRAFPMGMIRRAKKRYGPYIRWKRKLVRTITTGSLVVETARGPVEYAIDGDAGPFVAVFHGGPGGYDQARVLFGDLFGNGLRVLSWSRPGYVRTPLEVGRSFEEQAEVFAALMDALGIERTAVIAYSAGGPSAVHFASRHPGRIWALILECAVTLRYEINPDNIGENILFKHLMFHDPAMWLADVVAHHAPSLAGAVTIGMESTLTERDVLRLLGHIMKDPSRVHILMDLIRSMSPSRLRAKGLKNDLEQLERMGPLPLESLRAPTLVIHGTEDHDVPVEHAIHAARTIPASELYLVKNGFHIMALADAARDVAAKRLAFLKEHAPLS